MSDFLIRLAGPNYRVRITGLFEGIAVVLGGAAIVPYTAGDVALVIPPDWKPFFIRAALICYVISKILNSWWTKASNVSGNAAVGTFVESKGSTVAAIPPKTEPEQNPKPTNE